MQHAYQSSRAAETLSTSTSDSKRDMAPSGPIGHTRVNICQHSNMRRQSYTCSQDPPVAALRRDRCKRFGKVAVHNGLTLYLPACSPMPFRDQSRIYQAAAAQNGQNIHKAARKPLERT